MMNVVIIKHENCGNKFLFQVPAGEHLRAGDVVRVKTKKGTPLGTCLCDSFYIEDDGPELQSICEAFGATLPLAPVLGLFCYYPFRPMEEPNETVPG